MMEALYVIIGILICALVFAVFMAFSGVRTGGRLIPKPPEHLREKESALKMRNPPAPPLKKSEKAKAAYEKMINQLKYAEKAEIKNNRRKSNKTYLILSPENREKYIDTYKLKN